MAAAGQQAELEQAVACLQPPSPVHSSNPVHQRRPHTASAACSRSGRRWWPTCTPCACASQPDTDLLGVFVPLHSTRSRSWRRWWPTCATPRSLPAWAGSCPRACCWWARPVSAAGQGGRAAGAPRRRALDAGRVQSAERGAPPWGVLAWRALPSAHLDTSRACHPSCSQERARRCWRARLPARRACRSSTRAVGGGGGARVAGRQQGQAPGGRASSCRLQGRLRSAIARHSDPATCGCPPLFCTRRRLRV